MAKDVDRGLEWWSQFLPGCKAIGYLFCSARLLARVVGKLVLSTPRASLEFLFQKACPKPTEWRWARISQTVKHFVTVRRDSPLIWDPVEFAKGGGGQGGTQDEDAEELNLPVLTACIRNPT